MSSSNRLLYLADTLGVKPDSISSDTLQYYYTKFPEWCCPYDYQPLVSDVVPFDFQKPIDYMAKYFSQSTSDYFPKLQKKIRGVKDLVKFRQSGSTAEADQVILQYVRCRSDIRIITVWPAANLSDNQAHKFADHLRQFGHLYDYKKITGNYALGRGLVYQLYADKEWANKIQNIERDKTNWVGFDRSKEKTCWVYVFENTSDQTLIGKDAELKVQLRSYLAKQSVGAGDDSQDNRLKHIIHVNDFHYQTVEYAQVYFNDNSLQMLRHQNLKTLMSFHARKCRIYFNTTKKWLLENFQPVDRDRFLLFSSLALYVLGLRPCGDIDFHVLSTPSADQTKTEDFLQKVFYFLISSDSRKGKLKFLQSLSESDQQQLLQVAQVADGFYFSDLSFGDHFGLNWVFQAKDMKDKYENTFHIKQNHQEWVLNPAHHFYFLGLKILHPQVLSDRRMVVSLGNPTADFRKKYKRLADLYFLQKQEIVTVPNYLRLTPVDLYTGRNRGNQKTITMSQTDFLPGIHQALNYLYGHVGKNVSDHELINFLGSVVLQKTTGGRGKKKSPKRQKKSPKRQKKSPKRQKKSPKQQKKSPKRQKKSPKQQKKSPKRQKKSP